MIKKSKKKSSYRPRPDVYTSKDLKRMSELRSLASVDENKCVETAILPLTNVDYLDIWKASVRYLLKTQQPYISSEKWALCKQTALDFLELREDAVNKFHNIQEELRNVDFRTIHLLCDNILLKLQALKRFEAVYNRQPAPSGDLPPPTEPTYITGEVRPWNSRVVQAYADSNINENQSPTLIAILSTTTAISIIPLILSWRLSTNLPGTTEDVDFYLLIQNSMMQLLGLFMALYPTECRPASSAWHWARIFTATGAGCAIAAIPMYLYVPTMWSALMSFFASIAQAIMTLELVLMANSTVRSTKVKE